MPYNKAPRRSEGPARGYHQLSVGAIGECTRHALDLLAFLFDALQIHAFDLHHGIRIGVSRFSHVATERFTRFAVRYVDVLMGHIAPSVIALEIGGMLGTLGEHLFGTRVIDRHEAPLLVRSLVASAVMRMLGVMRIVSRTVTTQFVRMGHFVVVILTGMINTGAFLGSHLMESMGKVFAQMPFLGVGIQHLFVALHMVNMLTEHFPVGAIGKCLGRENHSGFSQSGMARGLDGPAANDSVVLDIQFFLDGLHGFPSLVGCARNWAFSTHHGSTSV